jgi:hypothetical protein
MDYLVPRSPACEAKKKRPEAASGPFQTGVRPACPVFTAAPLVVHEQRQKKNDRQLIARPVEIAVDAPFPLSESCGLRRLDGGDHLDQTGCSPRSHRNQSPKLESGTEFFAAETGRRNGLIRLDCRSRDRANQSIVSIRHRPQGTYLPLSQRLSSVGSSL